MNSITNIFKNNYSPERPWSLRPNNGYRSKLIKKIRNIFDLLSGYEFINLIKDIITPDELKKIAGIYYDGLKNLSKPINSVKQKNRHIFYYQLKLAKIPLRELKKMNYKISNRLWKTCTNTSERLVGGRPPLSLNKITQINDILESNSAISSFKTAKIVKRTYFPKVSRFEQTRKALKNIERNNLEINIENVRLRKISIQDIKDSFDIRCQQSNQARVSLSWIQKYIKKAKKYKKPQNVNLFCFHNKK